MSETMDEVYHERDQVLALVAFLAVRVGWLTWIGEHEQSDPDWEAEWRHILYIQLPTGQVSWHIHDSELPLFPDIPIGTSAIKWDGHTVEEKYKRLERLVSYRVPEEPQP